MILLYFTEADQVFGHIQEMGWADGAGEVMSKENAAQNPSKVYSPFDFWEPGQWLTNISQV
jgi:hypothetical protein